MDIGSTLRSWPRWAKIGVPMAAAVLVIGGVAVAASGGDDNGAAAAPRRTTTSDAPNTTLTTAVPATTLPVIRTTVPTLPPTTALSAQAQCVQLRDQWDQQVVTDFERAQATQADYRSRGCYELCGDLVEDTDTPEREQFC